MNQLTAEVLQDFFDGEMCDKRRAGYFDFGNNEPCPCKKCVADRTVGRALQLVAESTATGRAVDVIDENNKWRFAPGVSARKHFWSTDGVECLWCAVNRTPAAIAAWFAAGKPAEDCVYRSGGSQ